LCTCTECHGRQQQRGSETPNGPLTAGPRRAGRNILQGPATATHTRPSPTATLVAEWPRRTVRSSDVVDSSIRQTSPSSPTTQTVPPPVATATGWPGTCTELTTAPVAGPTAATSPSYGFVTQMLPDPRATPIGRLWPPNTSGSGSPTWAVVIVCRRRSTRVSRPRARNHAAPSATTSPFGPAGKGTRSPNGGPVFRDWLMAGRADGGSRWAPRVDGPPGVPPPTARGTSCPFDDLSEPSEIVRAVLERGSIIETEPASPLPTHATPRPTARPV